MCPEPKGSIRSIISVSALTWFIRYIVIEMYRQPSYGGDRKILEVRTSALPKGTLGSVASLLAATLLSRKS